MLLVTCFVSESHVTSHRPAAYSRVLLGSVHLDKSSR